MVELVVDGLLDADCKPTTQHEGQIKSATVEREHGAVRCRLTTGMSYSGGEMAARAVLLIAVANSDNLYLYCTCQGSSQASSDRHAIRGNVNGNTMHDNTHTYDMIVVLIESFGKEKKAHISKDR